jgi:hypothetical protein
MAAGRIHTVPSKQGWRNEREGAPRALSTHKTKTEAVKAGRERARKDEAEHFIHNKDGSIGQRNSYGHDPRRRKG